MGLCLPLLTHQSKNFTIANVLPQDLYLECCLLLVAAPFAIGHVNESGPTFRDDPKAIEPWILDTFDPQLIQHPARDIISVLPAHSHVCNVVLCFALFWTYRNIFTPVWIFNRPFVLQTTISGFGYKHF